MPKDYPTDALVLWHDKCAAGMRTMELPPAGIPDGTISMMNKPVAILVSFALLAPGGATPVATAQEAAPWSGSGSDSSTYSIWPRSS